jgi:hypothetical protein
MSMYYSGAISPQEMNVIVENSDTVNEEVVIRFYSKIEAIYPDKKIITIISDNARYYKKVQK